MAVYNFRIKCETCGFVNKYAEETAPPNTCPNNPAHTIYPEQTAAVKGKSRQNILNEILAAAEPTVQLPRMLNALDKYPSFIAALDGYNYPLARTRLDLAVANTDITQDDYDLADSKIPSS
jgi:hypothetical protein